MRKFAGVLLAAAMVLPASLLVSPAGAVGGTSCKGGTSTATITPPWPAVGSKAKVLDTVQTTAGAITGCSGGGVTSASFKYQGVKAKAPGDNCLSNATFNTNAITSGTLTVNWKPSGTSIIKVSFHKIKGKPLSNTVSGKVTGGTLFKGSSITASFTYTFVPKTGCVTTPGAKVSVKIGAVKIK